MKMKSVIAKITAAAMLSLPFATVAAAADMERPYMPITGNLAVWGQLVVPSGYSHGGLEANNAPSDADECSDFSFGKNDFCDIGGGFGADGRLHYNSGEGYAIQFETLFDYHTSLHDDNDGDDDDDDADTAAIHGAFAAHWIARSEDTAYGLFTGLSGTQHMTDDDSPLHAFGGLEAAMHNGMTTFYGQVGGVFLLDGDDALKNMVFGRVGGRLFLDENSLIEASVGGGYAPDFDNDDPDTDRGYWFQGAAQYEQRLEDSPFSWFVGYQGDYVKSDESGCCDESAWVHTFLAGVRMNIGESLYSENRDGANTFQLMNMRAPLAYAGELN